jgi:uncharacterized membrane protein HdeD (DUF308 family)
MDGSTLLMIRGIVSVVIGFLAFAWPGITIAVLVGIFGLFAILDGITNMFVGLSARGPHGRSWAVTLQGVLGIAAGVLTFLWPGITALVLVLFIGSWALLTGVLEIVAAIRLRKVITGEWMLVLSGVLSIAFGVLVFFFPGAGAVGISWVLGAYTMAGGFILIALGLRLRSQIFAAAR